MLADVEKECEVLLTKTSELELVDGGHDGGGRKKVVKKWLTALMETRQGVTQVLQAAAA